MLTIYLYNGFIATSLKEATSGGSSSDALPLLTGVPVIGSLIYIDGIKSIIPSQLAI